MLPVYPKTGPIMATVIAHCILLHKTEWGRGRLQFIGQVHVHYVQLLLIRPSLYRGRSASIARVRSVQDDEGLAVLVVYVRSVLIVRGRPIKLRLQVKITVVSRCPSFLLLVVADRGVFIYQ